MNDPSNRSKALLCAADAYAQCEAIKKRLDAFHEALASDSINTLLAAWRVRDLVQDLRITLSAMEGHAELIEVEKKKKYVD